MLIQGKKYAYCAKAGENEGGGGTEADADQDKNKGGDGGEDADTVSPEIEEKARKMGWTPKDEFRGDPEKWRGAAEFVDRGENMLPILRKSVERQNREISDLKQTIKEFAEYNTKTEKTAFERALKELKAKQVKAVAAGDADAFVEVDEEIADLHKEAREKPQLKVKDDPGEDPEYLEWESRNGWIKKDMECAAYADSYAEFLRKTGDKRVGADFLDEVAKGVKEKFPKKFSNPRREQPGAVDGGGSAGRSKGGKTYADMPAEARAACDRMARNGYEGKTKEMADFKANYVRTYFEEE